MTKNTIKLQPRIPADWEPKLLELCKERGIDPNPPKGRAGGLTQLARDLIGEAIGEVALDYHEEKAKKAAKR